MNVRTAIVVPCYNEAARLDVSAFRMHVDTHADIGFVFVDDGSTDDTRQLLERTADGAERLAVLPLARNAGKGEAVRLGVLEALKQRPRFVGYWDADLATPLSLIADLELALAEEPEAELVMGARVALLGRLIRRRATRHYTGRVFATCASIALELPVYDTQCGAKLLRVTDRTHALFSQPFCSRWSFDVELIARIRDARAAADVNGDHGVREVPLRVWCDVPGSKVRVWQGVRALVDLARIRRRYPPPAHAGSW